MLFRTLLGLLIMLIACSCAQQPTKSGLLIDNGINRGVSYTDSLGTKYNLRYIPITITNDSTIPIHLHIAFSKEYHYPETLGGDKFHVFLFPQALHPDSITYDTLSYELGNPELRAYFDEGSTSPAILNQTLELASGEQRVIGIGTLYPSSPKISGVLPNALFSQDNSDLYHACDGQLTQDLSTNLGLKLTFKESCTIIPCGQILYPER